MSVNPKTNAARCSGACDKLTTVLKAIAAPTKRRTTDDTIAAFVITLGTSFHFNDFKTNKPINIA